MSYEERSRLAYIYGRRLTCKRCKARPGTPCKTRSGNKAASDHSERHCPGWSKAAAAKWRDPSRTKKCAECNGTGRVTA